MVTRLLFGNKLRESEERFRTLTVATNQVVWTTNAKGEVIDEIPTWQEFTGLSKEDVKGWGWISAIHGDDIERVTAIWRSALATSSIYEAEYRARRHDGVYRYFSARGVPVFDRNGTIREWVGTCTDITEQKQAADREAELSRIVEGSLNEIYIFDAHTLKLLMANRGARENLGYAMAELAQLTPLDLKPDFTPTSLAQLLEPLMNREKEYVRFETVHRRKDGTRYPVDVHINVTSFQGKNAFMAVTLDITQRKQTETRLIQSEELYRSLITGMTAGVVLQDANGTVLACNPSAERILGLKEMEMAGRTATDPRWGEIHEDGSAFSEMDNPALAALRTGLPQNDVVMGLRRPDANIVWISINAQPLFKRAEPKPYAAVVSFNDITERRQMEEGLRLSSLVLENSSEGMLVTDENNRIIAINPAFTTITGYSFDEVHGRDPKVLSSGRHDNTFYQAMWHALETTGRWQGEIWDRRKNGEIHAKWMTINTIRNKAGSVHRYVALFSDITEKKQADNIIWKQANFDTLTGLPNRNMLHERLRQETMKSVGSQLPLALLLIDLDHFKEVNDTLGHAIGDALLREAASRINACVRDSDTVARLGGDEFAVILSSLSDNSFAENVAQRIIKRMTEPYHLETEVVYVSASIGITLYPHDAADIDTLIKNADQAMYAAKYKGRNRFSYFTIELQQAAQTRLRLANDLRSALAYDQFKVYFQPIIELSTGQIHKAEALIRWQHPDRGLVSPMEFVPLAEETGLIVGIGDWVFNEVARHVCRWREIYHPQFQVSINKSPIQFRDDNSLHEAWLDRLNELNLPGQCVAIEITESLLLNVNAMVTNKLLAFRDAGIQVAIDDFGTGYSSISYLKKFDIDYLKIDRSFVSNIETDPDERVLSQAIIVLAHTLGLKVIAEGVETTGQRDLLIAAGCDYAQGYLFSKPLPLEEFEKLLVH